MSIRHGWQRLRRLQVAYGVLWLLLTAWSLLVSAEQFTGKVVEYQRW
jgi:hypothetical protein